MTDAKPISMNPDDFVEGGGLLDDMDVTVVAAKWAMFDYGGTVPDTPTLMWELQVDGADETTKQHWSCGAAKDFMPNPSDSGDTLLPVGTATGIRKTTNVADLFRSLIDSGFPKDRLSEGRAGVYTGMRCHVLRVPAQLRPNLKPKKAKEYEDTVLIVGEIHKLPWEAKTTGSKSAGAGAASTDDSSAIEEAVIGIVASAGDNGIAKKDLITALTKEKSLKADTKLRNRALVTVNNDAWLGDGDRPWTLDNGVVKMG